jgi:hypothetical protein
MSDSQFTRSASETTAAHFSYYQDGDAAYDAQQTGNLRDNAGNIAGCIGYHFPEGYIILAASKNEAKKAVKHLISNNIQPINK